MMRFSEILKDVQVNGGYYERVGEFVYTLVFMGWGYSVDDWRECEDGGGFWEEREMIYLGFPEYCGGDTYEEWIEYRDSWEVPTRIHDYKSTVRTYTVELPSNHDDMLSFYTPERLLGDCEYGDDNPGYGFSYLNCETDEDGEMLDKYHG